MNAWSDLRYAARTLARQPGFAAVAVLTLALGIGANTAIFSIVNAGLIRPLEYRDPARLVAIWEFNPAIQVGIDLLPARAINWARWRSRNHVFEDIAAFDRQDVHLTTAGMPERFRAARATSGFFAVLGVKPYLGRTFVPEEDLAGSGKAAIISYALWRDRFGSDPGLVGRVIRLNGQGYTVAGVMPPGFEFPRGAEVPAYFEFGPRTDIWLSTGMTKAEMQNGSLSFGILARLKPGVSLEQARAEMSVISRQLEKEDPNNQKGFSVRIIPLHEQIVSGLRPALMVIMAAVAAVLLIACANLASLLLARAVSRKQEIAVRAALGAGRWQLVRQLLAESLLLSLTGGLVGLVLGCWGTKLLLTMMPAGLPRVGDARLDLTVVAFTFCVSVLTGVVFGLAPAWNVTRLDLNRCLKEGGRGSGTPASPLLRKCLVVSEVAVALVLTVSAGLLLRSFLRLHSIDPGFQPSNVIAVDLSFPSANPFEPASTPYDSPGRKADFIDRVIERAASLPGVTHAGAISELPLAGGENIEALTFEGRPAPDPAHPPFADQRLATPGYLRTMGIPLLKGRWITKQDQRGSLPVAVIDETMARKYWPGESPIGRRFHTLDPDSPWWTVVGVVRSVSHRGLAEEKRPEYFRPYAQRESRWITLVIRSSVNPVSLIPALRREIRSIDKDQPISKVVTLDQVVSDAVAAPRFRSALVGLFGVFAILLASLGIYGVISYSVAQQTHDIGVRMALGARKWDILRYVAGGGGALAAIGIAIGLAVELAVARLLAGLLFGVSPTDVWTFCGAASLLLAVALVASYIPARRAARVDPLIALRYQ